MIVTKKATVMIESFIFTNVSRKEILIVVVCC
jgi:hypothetical protein